MTHTIELSRPNKALVLSQQIGHWPGSIRGTLADGRLVVDHSYQNTTMLRNAGHNVPLPMECYYDWPHPKGQPPFAVQRRSALLLAGNRRCYLLNQQGTGKTRTTLWAWDALNRAGEASKCLIVAKLSTLKFVWAREIYRVFPNRRCVMLGSVTGMSKAQRIKELAQEADIYIINHDGIKVIEEELRARTDIDTLVLDEMAIYRNNSDRSKCMRGFAQRFKYVWGLTGSPMPNQVTDVWGQCKIITPTTVPKYFKACRELLMNRRDQWTWTPKPNAVDMAFAMMQPSARYKLDDVLELPPVIERDIEVGLSEEQKFAYDSFKKNLAIMVDAKQVTAANAAALGTKLLQISGGWVYTSAPEYVGLNPRPRLNLLRDIIEENDRKVLIFAPYKHMVAEIGKFLNSKDGLGADSCAVYDGDDKVLFDFQDTAKYKALVSHPGPIGHGNTLTSANMVIWYSPVADYEVFEHACFRIRRISQEHKQQILYFCSTPAETKFYGILTRKENIQEAFLALVEEASREP